MPSPLMRLAAFLICLLFPLSQAMGENSICSQKDQAYEPVQISATDNKASAEISAQALEGFYDAAFHSEYGDTDRDALLRWEIPLKLFVKGDATPEDMQTLQTFLENLKTNVPGLPDISFTDTQSEATVVISFVPFLDMADTLKNYVSNNWGFMNCFSDDTTIRYGLIAIATDVTEQADRNHLIQEEFVNMLGLTADLDFGQESIIYQPYTTTQTLADMDYEMLNLLYSPDLKFGMSLAQVKAALESVCKGR